MYVFSMHDKKDYPKIKFKISCKKKEKIHKI